MPIRTQTPRPIPSAAAVVLLALLGSAGCAGAASSAQSSRIELAEEGPARERAGNLLFRGGLYLRPDIRDFGGLSALRVSPDGSQFVAVTDRGGTVSGRLAYGRDGRLRAASDIKLRPLLGEDGAPLKGGAVDAEGLALLGPWPGDGWVVSFERDHRLSRYGAALGKARAQPLAVPDELAALDFNQGIETLAALPDGRLLLIAEGAQGDGLHPGWLGRPAAWTPFRYKALPPFLPVDAAVLPGGDLVVLERRASLLGGWGSRVVRVAAADLDRGGVVEGRELGRIGPPMVADNYEGIDARRTADGRTLVYLLSDDNFHNLQRTLLLMFELSEG